VGKDQIQHIAVSATLDHVGTDVGPKALKRPIFAGCRNHKIGGRAAMSAIVDGAVFHAAFVWRDNNEIRTTVAVEVGGNEAAGGAVEVYESHQEGSSKTDFGAGTTG
jgi:hypothetical protein